MPKQWLDDVFEFAIIPDRMIYLDVNVEHLLPRVLSSRQLDHWESGEDYLRGADLHNNFINYQEALLNVFRELAEEHGFVVVDARRSVGEVFETLRAEVQTTVAAMDRH